MNLKQPADIWIHFIFRTLHKDKELSGSKGAVPVTGDEARAARWLLLMAAALCVISGRKAGIFARENR